MTAPALSQLFFPSLERKNELAGDGSILTATFKIFEGFILFAREGKLQDISSSFVKVRMQGFYGRVIIAFGVSLR